MSQTKTKTQGSQATDRRTFLRLAGAGGVAGSLALIAGASGSEAESVSPNRERLYQETEHVRRYYALARF